MLIVGDDNAQEWHPDRKATESDQKKQEAEKRFKDIGEAYEVLADEKKRQRYDMYVLHALPANTSGELNCLLCTQGRGS